MANFFWVGGSATWDSTAGSKWAASSGAAASYIIAPTILDDVYFDAASGASTVVFASGINCRSLNFTGFTGSFTGASAANTVNIYGGLTMGTGMTVPAATNTFNFAATTTNAGAGHPITSNGKMLPNVTFNGVGGKWTLQDALTCSVLTVTAGHFDSGSQNISATRFLSSNNNVRTISLGSSIISLSTDADLSSVGNLTWTANTAVLRWSTQSGISSGNQFDYQGLSLEWTAIGSVGATLFGAGIFKDLTCVGAAPTAFLSLNNNPVFTGTVSLSGNSSTNRLLVQSNTLGTPRVITAGAVSLTDVDFMDIAIVGPTGSTITSDSFNRSDGALTGSTSDAADGGSGLTWTSAANITIVGNRARLSSGTTGVATVDVGTPNQFVSAKWEFTNEGAIFGLALRYTDSTNNIRITSGGSRIYGYINGSTQVFLNTASLNPNTGDVIGVAVVGNAILLYKNGTLVYTGVLPSDAPQTGNSAGIVSVANGSSDVYWDDFKVEAVPDVTGTRLGDCLGNSGITFTTASGTARDGGGAGVKRYAVAAGNFSSTAMWSETSGGSPGASVPLPQDDVYLDANSAAGTYTMNMPRVCRNLDATGFTRSLTNTAVTTTSYGSFNVPATSTIVGTNTWVANLYGRGTHTLSLPVMQFYSNLNINIAAVGGTYTLASVIDTRTSTSTNNLLNILCGTFNTANYDMYIGQLVPGTATSLPCTVNLGTSTCYLGYNTSTIPYQYQGTPVLNASSATIIYVKDSNNGVLSRTFQGGNQVYGTLTCIVADTPGSLTITGSNTFNTVNIGSGRSLKLTSGTTQKIGTLNLNGVPRGGVRLPGVGGTYLSTPDSAAVSVTGDIDIRVRVALTDWTPGASQALIGKYVSTANQGSYILAIDTGGRPNFLVSDSGGGGSWVYVGGAAWVDGTTYWVRVTHTMAGLLRFFYAADSSTMPTSWTQLGSDQTAFTYGKYDSTAPLEIGSYGNGVSMNAVGTFYRAQIRNNVLDDGSGIVFDTDLTVPFGPRFYDTANGAVVTPSNTLANVGDGRVVIESATANSPATLQVDTVTDMNYVDLKDVVMNGADTYIEATSVIRSNVKGVRRGPQTGMSMMMGV